MPKFKVRYHQPIWETFEFEIEACDKQNIEENIDSFIDYAIEHDYETGFDISSGDSVGGIDPEIEIIEYPEYPE